MSHILIPHRSGGVALEVHAHQRDGQSRDMILPSSMLTTSPFEHLKLQPLVDEVRFRPLQPWDQGSDRITGPIGAGHVHTTIDYIRDNLDLSKRHNHTHNNNHQAPPLIEEMDRCFEVAFALQRAHRLDRPVAFDNSGKARQ